MRWTFYDSDVHRFVFYLFGSKVSDYVSKAYNPG